MSSNSLAKTAAARRRAANPYSLGSALTNGGPWVWASCLLMGLGNFAAGQLIKGLLFLAIEVIVVWYMFNSGLYWLQMFPSLGDREEQEIFNEELGYFEYIPGDNSQQILLYSVATMAILVAFIVIWRASVRSGYEALCYKRSGKHVPNFWEDIKALFDKNVHKLLMTVPFLSLIIFTVIPLFYMMMMAFTNYTKVGGHLILFDWVGFENFKNIFSSGSVISKQFWSVLGWTLIWAFFATFLNFFFGTFVAMIVNRPTTKLKGLWRTVLSLTIAVPQFVSLLIIRTMLKEQGIVNSFSMVRMISKETN
jgi:arabinogalactan oligomer/maltooligosaccharide transport system permease protein